MEELEKQECEYVWLTEVVQENWAGGVSLLLLLPCRLHAREADSQNGATDGGRLKLSKRAGSVTVLL